MKCDKCGQEGLEYSDGNKVLLEPCTKNEAIKALKEHGLIKLDNSKIWKQHNCYKVLKK